MATATAEPDTDTSTDIPTQDEIASRSYDWGHEVGDYVPAAHPEFKRRRDSEQAHKAKMGALRSAVQGLRGEAEDVEAQADAAAAGGDDDKADELYQKAEDLRAKAERKERALKAKNEAFEPLGIDVEAAKTDVRQKIRRDRADAYATLLESLEGLDEAAQETAALDKETSNLSGPGLAPKQVKVKTGQGTYQLERYLSELSSYTDNHSQ